MTDVIRITACRLCDSPSLDLVVSFAPTPPGDQYLTEKHEQPCYPLDVLCCKDCGAVQLADTVDPKLIYPEYLYTTSVSKGLPEHFQRYAADVTRRVIQRPGALVIDIGSNDGTLLKAFQALGCKVLGVEPALAIATKAHREHGTNSFNGFFSQDMASIIRREKDYGQADIITANHVMANVADLHDFTEGVKHLLAPQGTFVFETGYWPAIVDDTLIDTIEHEHIHYFAVKPLVTFFAKHGLRLVSVARNSTKGGSLRGYVQHAAHSMADSSVPDMIAAERPYTVPQSLADWAAGLKQLEAQVKDAIASSKDETWVGYGAAVGSTLQIYQFGLGDKLTALVDVNPLKQGRLSPGFHLKVLDPSELCTLNPDRIVILAWRYAAMIQARHPEFAGKFLIPLPQMRTT